MKLIVSCVAVCIVSLLTTSLLAVTLQADEASGWPREIQTPKGRVVMYQPQPEWFEGNQLAARAAVSVTPADSKQPVFGVVWTTARVETDREANTVYILGVQVTDVRFPEATDAQLNELKALIEQEVPTWELDVSYDQLLASLAAVERDTQGAQGLSTDPPQVIFSTAPAVLLVYDGEPRALNIDDSSFQRVANTAQAVIYDPRTGNYFLSGGAIWYRADDAKGPWEHIEQPPKDVAALVPVEEDDRASSEDEPVSTAIPRIVVATEPTELIVSDGDPAWTPISGTNLLFMSNSESDVLMDIETQRKYVLISGRWYDSMSLEGPWAYVAADALPAEFASIPYESANGHLLMFIAGTDQANEAVRDAQIPQTSTVSRESSAPEVTYDGEPAFEAIEQTEMEYAVNTAFSVIRNDNRYYVCHEAVWYESTSPDGPWTVAVSVPSQIQSIPPSCPVHNVKYVYVYDYTPSVVYVGYTAGYMGGYVYGPTIVYGTGWYYPPYWGPRYYYPRPVTYGFHVRYNPYYGWSFGMSFSRGPFRVSFVSGGYHRGYWGPQPYRPYPHRSYTKNNINVNRNINVNTGDINIGRQPRREGNVYDRPANRERNVDRPATADRKRPDVSNRKNDVYADRDGNVHRRGDSGWEKRDRGGWTPSEGGAARPSQPGAGAPDRTPPNRPQEGARPSSPSAGKTPQARPSQPSSGSRPQVNRGGGSSKQQLNRDHQARQRGSQRSQSSRGGGGRRR